MRPTNYYLFDFLDFDESLNEDESLWKAYPPTAVYEQNGMVCLDVPFQCQKLDNEMAADTAVPLETHTVYIIYYTPGIVRIFFSTKAEGCPDETIDQSEMLQLSPEVQRVPLRLKQTEKGYQASADGVVRLDINLREALVDRWSALQPDPQPTLDITLYPSAASSSPKEIRERRVSIRLAAYDHFSPPRYDALPLAYCKANGQINRATLSFEATHDECFAGTGERFMKMDLSGQSFFLKNQDGQGVNNRRTYKNVPFYLSSRGYGVFYHTCAYCKIDLAHQSSRSVQFLNYQPQLDAFIIGGPQPTNILKSYRMLTGFPQMPPLWSFGVWMSRMTYFSADEVNNICDRLRKEHYPCDVIHLDTGWFKTDWLCEWKFNDERFPNPQQFMSELKEKGFRVSLWQLPYVAEDAEQIDEAREHHYIGTLNKKQASEGSNFSALDYAGTIDFTSPEATRWYQGLLKNLLDMGASCIKTDFGENIHMDATYANMAPELLNNLYALLYQKAAFNITKETTGEGIVWARAAWAGCQRYPLHWGGDSCSSWDGMAGSLRGGLHFGLSGFAFWSHDVPGFHTLPNFMNGIVDDDVYVRWTQFGVFSSHIRYHGTNKREPWHYPNIADIVRRWWNLRYALIPYILKQSEQACRSGHPLIEALLVRHSSDKNCWQIDDEYYFGDTFLVCPVMNSQNQRNVYLPKGEWVHFFTGERYLSKGGWFHFENIPLEEMPVFVHPEAHIPIYPYEVECTDQMDLTRTVTLEIDHTFSGYII